MDRRVFQPRPTGSAERRRSALMVSALILLAGALWLGYAKHHPVPRAVPPVPERSIPHA